MNMHGNLNYESFNWSVKDIKSQQESVLLYIKSWRETFSQDELCDASNSEFMLLPELTELHSKNSHRIMGICINNVTTGLMYCQPSQKSLGPLKLPYVQSGGHYVNDLLICQNTNATALNLIFKETLSKYQQALWIDFERMSQTTLNQIRKKFPADFTIYSKPVDYHYVFDVQKKTNHTFSERLSKKMNANLRYARRLADRRLGEIKLLTIKPTSLKENKVWLDIFLDMETRGWKRNSGNPVAFEENKVNYYRAMTNLATQSGHMRWAVMQTKNQPMAILLVFERGSKAWVLKTAYDEAYAQYSPGALILTNLLEHYYEYWAVKSVDMISNYQWLERWNPETEPYFSVRIFPKTGFRKVTSVLLSFLHREWLK